MMPKTLTKCRVCGDIHYGGRSPKTCPTCNTVDAYMPLGKEEARNLMGM